MLKRGVFGGGKLLVLPEDAYDPCGGQVNFEELVLAELEMFPVVGLEHLSLRGFEYATSHTGVGAKVGEPDL